MYKGKQRKPVITSLFWLKSHYIITVSKLQDPVHPLLDVCANLCMICKRCLLLLDCGFLREGLHSHFLHQSKGCDFTHVLWPKASFLGFMSTSVWPDCSDGSSELCAGRLHAVLCLNALCYQRYVTKGFWHTHLFLCGDVDVALTQVKEQVLVDLLSDGGAGNLAVHKWLSGQVHLDRKQNGNSVRHEVLTLTPAPKLPTYSKKMKKESSTISPSRLPPGCSPRRRRCDRSPRRRLQRLESLPWST